MSEKTKKEAIGIEKSEAAPKGMSCSACINDISKRLRSLTLKKIDHTTEASGVSQCTRAILRSLTAKNGVTQLALCNDINYTAPTVSVALKRMAYDGLLKLVIDPSDKRQTLIYITDKGVETGNYLNEAYSGIDRILLEGISAEERELLMPLLEKMLCNVAAAQKEASLDSVKRKPKLKLMNAKRYNEMKRKEETVKRRKD